MARSAPDAVEILSELARSYHAAYGTVEKTLKTLRVTPAQFGLLSILALERRESTQTTARTFFGTSAGGFSRLIGDLERAGHVSSRRDPADRRRRVLHLTTSGRALLKRLDRSTRPTMDRFLAALTTEERKGLLLLLRKTGARTGSGS